MAQRQCGALDYVFQPMKYVVSRTLILKRLISEQIELVAQSICEEGRAFEAMQVLESLTSELIAEEHRLSDAESDEG